MSFSCTGARVLPFSVTTCDWGHCFLGSLTVNVPFLDNLLIFSSPLLMTLPLRIREPFDVLFGSRYNETPRHLIVKRLLLLRKGGHDEPNDEDQAGGDFPKVSAWE